MSCRNLNTGSHRNDLVWGMTSEDWSENLIDLVYLRLCYSANMYGTGLGGWIVEEAMDLQTGGAGFTVRAGRKVIVGASHGCVIACRVQANGGKSAVSQTCLSAYKLAAPFAAPVQCPSVPDAFGAFAIARQWCQQTYGIQCEAVSRGDLRSRA